MTIRGKEGFTLGEVMVALTILAMVLIPLASMFMGIVKSVIRDRLIISATTQAERKIEQMRNQAAVFAGLLPAGYNNLVGGTDIVDLGRHRARRTWTVAENIAGHHKTVTIWVEDLNLSPAFPKMTAQTIVAEPGR